jgi:hypothetical protein
MLDLTRYAGVVGAVIVTNIIPEARSDVKILEYRNHGLSNILSRVGAVDLTYPYKNTLDFEILVEIMDNDADESERIR